MKKRIKINENQLKTLVTKVATKKTINENRKQLKSSMLNKGLITQDEFDMIVNADPTPTKKYSLWMGKVYKNENVDIDHIRNTVEEFDTYVNRGIGSLEKDINKYIFTFNFFQEQGPITDIKYGSEK